MTAAPALEGEIAASTVPPSAIEEVTTVSATAQMAEEPVNALFVADDPSHSEPAPGIEPAAPQPPLPPLGFVILEKPGQLAPAQTIEALGNDHPVVFVTYSGDNGPGEAARAAGAIVVKMRGENETPPARSRNAGFRQLRKLAEDLDYVQFLDGDSVIHPQWLQNACAVMERRPELAILEGVTVDTGTAVRPQGMPEVKEIRATGDNVLMRVKNFVELGGFRGDLMVADIQDFCLRTRGRGHHVGRVDVPMVTAMQKKKSVASWWARHRENGFNNAFSAALHGSPPERFKVAETRETVLWGFGIPAVALLAAAAITGFTYYVVPIGIPILWGIGVLLGVLLLYFAKALYHRFAERDDRAPSLRFAASRLLGVFPAFIGIVTFYRWRRQQLKTGT